MRESKRRLQRESEVAFRRERRMVVRVVRVIGLRFASYSRSNVSAARAGSDQRVYFFLDAACDVNIALCRWRLARARAASLWIWLGVFSPDMSARAGDEEGNESRRGVSRTFPRDAVLVVGLGEHHFAFADVLQHVIQQTGVANALLARRRANLLPRHPLPRGFAQNLHARVGRRLYPRVAPSRQVHGRRRGSGERDGALLDGKAVPLSTEPSKIPGEL